MHRNTYTLVVALAILSALLMGIQIGRSMKPQQPEPSPLTIQPTPSIRLPIPTVTSNKTYTDKTCGVSLLYPDRMEIIETSNSGILITNPKDTKESILVICQNDIPRVPLPPEAITSVTLNIGTVATVSAKIYHDSSQKDGSRIDRLIFTHPKSRMDVLVAGFGKTFDEIIQSIHVID